MPDPTHTELVPSTHAELVLWESQLKTIHGKDHPKAGQPVRTYLALRLTGNADDGTPIYRSASRWHEEPEDALKQAKETR